MCSKFYIRRYVCYRGYLNDIYSRRTGPEFVCSKFYIRRYVCYRGYLNDIDSRRTGSEFVCIVFIYMKGYMF